MQPQVLPERNPRETEDQRWPDDRSPGRTPVALQRHNVRVVKPNLLFCIHQWDSEGVGRGEGECGRLGRAKWVVG